MAICSFLPVGGQWFSPLSAHQGSGVFEVCPVSSVSFSPWTEMGKTDLAARPIYHHTRDSIEAHLTIVFAALAVSRWIETTTSWSIRKFVTTTHRYRTIEIQAGDHTITAADPIPDDLQAALDAIHGPH